MASIDKYVVNGATMSCTGAQAPYPASRSIFRCTNVIHTIQGKAVGTQDHYLPVLNVPPFGICRILTAAAAGTPTPCTPFPGPWKDTFGGLLSMGRKTLLRSSYTDCAFKGLIEFRLSGQVAATLGNLSSTLNLPQPPVVPPALPALASALPAGKLFVLDPGNSTTGWNSQLNQALQTDAHYLVGEYLYKTDAEGRINEVRGVLNLQPHERNVTEQNNAPSLKDGMLNPNFVPDLRTPNQKRRFKMVRGVKTPNPAYRPIVARTALQERRYLDDGGHLFGAQFNGPGEQINYVPQHMDQNQANARPDTWWKMEADWARHLRNNDHVYVQTRMRYPQAAGSSFNYQTMRPDLQQAKYWINGELTVKNFFNH